MDTNQHSLSISRRSFLAFAGAASSVALLVPRQLLSQDDGLVPMARKSAASANITVQKLRGNISVLMGAGGNIAVLPGPDGKLLIDAGFAGARPKLSNALASISSDPIKHLINTHWHFDHTDGNEWLHSVGASILAHTNTNSVYFTDADVFHVGDTFRNGYYPFIEKVATLKKQGKSLDEIVATKPTGTTDAKWGNGFRKPKDFIGDVFQGV